jgi:hypothetical protein
VVPELVLEYAGVDKERLRAEVEIFPTPQRKNSQPDAMAVRTNGVPHPAVFVLDRHGHVRWAKLESDYRQRPTNEEIAAALDRFE